LNEKLTNSKNEEIKVTLCRNYVIENNAKIVIKTIEEANNKDCLLLFELVHNILVE
jgi:hypothetical protein